MKRKKLILSLATIQIFASVTQSQSTTDTTQKSAKKYQAKAHVDAILATHSDNDHYSVETFKDLSPLTKAYHSTVYVDSLMKNEGLHSFGHYIGDIFRVGDPERLIELVINRERIKVLAPGEPFILKKLKK